MFIKADHKYLQYSGRIDTAGEAYLFVYPATYAAIRFCGTAVSAVLQNRRQYWGNYMGVLIDGVQSTVCLTQNGGEDDAGVRTVMLAKGLPDGEHTLLFFKRQDACHEVLFYGFELPEGSEVLPMPEKPGRRIEVYGDSVSAGEVSEAIEYTGMADPEHNGEYSNVWYSYAWMTARRLHAELHDIAQGGIALLDREGYFNEPDYIGMENVWDKLQYNPAYGEVTAWDFSRYTPHVVVVAIGQNDSHPEDYVKDDPCGAKAKRWKDHYRELVEKIRAVYPKARIILATTILNHDKSRDDAIEEVCGQLKDPRITHFLYQRNGCGTPGHIRIGEAQEMSEELAAYIESFGEEIWEA